MEAGAPLNRQVLVEGWHTPQGKPGSDVVSELIQASFAVTLEHDCEAITTVMLVLINHRAIAQFDARATIDRVGLSA
jgi:hypothetical protein